MKEKLTLDVGCGATYFEPRPTGNVNLDIETPTIKITNFVRGDANNLPFNTNTFTTVYCFELIEHVNSPIHLVEELRRVLKPEGQMLLSTPNPYHVPKLFRMMLRGTYSEWSDKLPHIASFTSITLKQLIEKVFGNEAIFIYRHFKRDNYTLNHPHHRFYNFLRKIIPFKFMKYRKLLVKVRK